MELYMKYFFHYKKATFWVWDLKLVFGELRSNVKYQNMPASRGIASTNQFWATWAQKTYQSITEVQNPNPIFPNKALLYIGSKGKSTQLIRCDNIPSHWGLRLKNYIYANCSTKDLPSHKFKSLASIFINKTSFCLKS